MTHTLTRAFLAARTLRWHTNHRMAGTGDYLDGHQGRVARIILALHPDPSADLLRAALTHDDGEHALGDMRGDAKRNLPPELRALIDRMEEDARSLIWGPDPDLHLTNARWLEFADQLDAVMWVALHRPACLFTAHSQFCIFWLTETAAALGIDIDVAALLQEVAES